MMDDAFEENLIENYYINRSIPCPTIIEALSRTDFSSKSSYNKAQNFLLKNFNRYCILSNKKYRLGAKFPKIAVSFVVPLDFYIPIFEPYNACVIGDSSFGQKCIVCGSIFSFVSAVNDTKYRTSGIICTVCGDDSDAFINRGKDVKYDGENLSKTIVDCCNRIIGSYESIPGRHTHYFHRITYFQLPSELYYFSFSRTKGTLIDDGTVLIHSNVLSDLHNSEKLPTNEELGVFRDVHINFDTVFINVIDLILKIKDAIYLKCKGLDSDAILLADNFAELCMGFLYCETRRVVYGEEKDAIIEKYKEISGKEGWFAELASTFRFPGAKKYKKAILYDKYYEKCRLVRNDLSHRFLLKQISFIDSEEALKSVCDMMTKACRICYDLMPTSVDKDRIGIIIDSMEFPLRDIKKL